MEFGSQPCEQNFWETTLVRSRTEGALFTAPSSLFKFVLSTSVDINPAVRFPTRVYLTRGDVYLSAHPCKLISMSIIHHACLENFCNCNHSNAIQIRLCVCDGGSAAMFISFNHLWLGHNALVYKLIQWLLPQIQHVDTTHRNWQEVSVQMIQALLHMPAVNGP